MGEATGPAERPRHALVLSGSLGAAHDVVAGSVLRSLERRGWTGEVLDAMALLGPRGARAGERTFRALMAVPGLYDAFHFAGLRAGSRLALRADRSARDRVVPRLRARLAQRPTDLLVSVFATGAGAAAQLRREGGPAHLTFCPDALPHRLWVHEGTDLHLVLDAAAEAAVRRYDPSARTAVAPLPVRPAFHTPPSRRSARAELGIPPTAPCVLLMAGGWGLAHLADIARRLADVGLHVLVVAGRNPPLERRLRAAAATRPRLHPFGYTREVPALMAAADLVVTTSGCTCEEARVIGRPLLLLDDVPGHGRENLQRQLALGGADVTTREPDAVVHAALSCLHSGRAVPPAAGAAAAAGWEAAMDSALVALGLGDGEDAGTAGEAEVVDLRAAREHARTAPQVARQP